MSTLSQVSCVRCGHELKGKQSKYCSKACRVAGAAKERREQIAQIKVDKGCARCGYNAHPAALHFNHIDPSTKELTISYRMSIAWDRILNEIDKCEVLCANCHSIHSYENDHQTSRVGPAGARSRKDSY